LNKLQQRLTEAPNVKYSYGPYNKIKDTKQWIRLTEGCPWNCPWCYEPQRFKVFKVPEIKSNDVGIIDMNFFCKKESLYILKNLPVKYKNKIIRYEFICGIDYRFINEDIIFELKRHHFKRIRIAWDWFYKDQLKVKDALKVFYKGGYKPEDIIIFMICNHPSVSFDECCKKLDLCKIWNIKVADCYYDNQIDIFKKFISIGWTTDQAHTFRKMVRKHNRMVLFKIDPKVIGK
jgi:hypothetical protein